MAENKNRCWPGYEPVEQADHGGSHKAAQHLHAPGAKANKSNTKTSKRSSAAKRRTSGSTGKKGK